jgi:hypothetical protein
MLKNREEIKKRSELGGNFFFAFSMPGSSLMMIFDIFSSFNSPLISSPNEILNFFLLRYAALAGFILRSDIKMRKRFPPKHNLPFAKGSRPRTSYFIWSLRGAGRAGMLPLNKTSSRETMKKEKQISQPFDSNRFSSYISSGFSQPAFRHFRRINILGELRVEVESVVEAKKFLSSGLYVIGI